MRTTKTQMRIGRTEENDQENDQQVAIYISTAASVHCQADHGGNSRQGKDPFAMGQGSN